MKKIFNIAVLVLGAGLLGSASSALADYDHNNDHGPKLNRIVYQTSAEQWVKTDSAKVIVTVNAQLAQADAANLQNQVLNNLNKLSNKGTWRITQYNRSQNQSDLENIMIQAQARLPQNALGAIREEAKKLSKPGIKYTVSDIEFAPSQAAMTQTQDELRRQLYQNIKKEIDLLNNTYPENSYYVHRLMFSTRPLPTPSPMYRKARGAQDNMMAMAVASAPMPAMSPMAVSQKITMYAQVVISSTIAPEK